MENKFAAIRESLGSNLEISQKELLVEEFLKSNPEISQKELLLEVFPEIVDAMNELLINMAVESFAETCSKKETGAMACYAPQLTKERLLNPYNSCCE
ncbi:hypothetical protein [Nostoc sp. TCL240-02]|uniref:hypothetical protein n=1 Tax=Nostoc sp. TCL240-02 TaxID=2572090 RepID=UPI00157F84D0|nr:hypothetical protein [Nostoc sp. TCL240-02]QKQ75626.1 hypothetical protein FBB35_22120 [Nostoc sp. TCL240-02]